MKKRSKIMLGLSCVALVLSGLIGLGLNGSKREDIVYKRTSVCAVTGGGTSINMAYDAQDNNITTKSWRYSFTNSSSRDLAIRLNSKPIVSNMTIEYAAIPEQVADANQIPTENKTTEYQTQVIQPNQSVSIYIIANVIQLGAEATYSDNVHWQVGTPISTTFVDSNGVEKQDYVIAGMRADELPSIDTGIEGYEFEGWYLDEALTIPVTNMRNVTGVKLYPRVPNLPVSDTASESWLQLSSGKYHVKKGTLALPENLVIPSTYKGLPVTTINDNAFKGVTNIQTVSIPNSVTSISSNAFKGCSVLTSINIPSSVTSIGNSAFSGCSALTSIEIPDSVTSIYNNTFWDCSSLTSITIPSSVTSIGNYAFYGCKALTSINIPNSVTSMGDSMFYNCSALISINIPNSVTSMGSAMFYNCKALTNIQIPNSITSIRSNAFENCSSLKSINIPSGVTSIESRAFQSCIALVSVAFEEN